MMRIIRKYKNKVFLATRLLLSDVWFDIKCMFCVLCLTFYVLCFAFNVLCFTFYVLRLTFYVLRVTKYVLCFKFYVLSVTFYFCVLRLCLTLTIEVFFCRFHYGDYFVKYAFHVFVDGCEHGVVYVTVIVK